MKSIWSKKWKQVLVWFSGYVGFLAFALVGGYAIVKEDDEVKKTAKQTFLVVLIFAGISALLALLNHVGGFSDNYYNSALYDFYSTMQKLVSIAQTVVYAIFIPMTLFKKESEE